MSVCPLKVEESKIYKAIFLESLWILPPNGLDCM